MEIILLCGPDLFRRLIQAANFVVGLAPKWHRPHYGLGLYDKMNKAIATNKDRLLDVVEFMILPLLSAISDWYMQQLDAAAHSMILDLQDLDIAVTVLRDEITRIEHDMRPL